MWDACKDALSWDALRALGSMLELPDSLPEALPSAQFSQDPVKAAGSADALSVLTLPSLFSLTASWISAAWSAAQGFRTPLPHKLGIAMLPQIKRSRLWHPSIVYFEYTHLQPWGRYEAIRMALRDSCAGDHLTCTTCHFSLHPAGCLGPMHAAASTGGSGDSASLPRPVPRSTLSV